MLLLTACHGPQQTNGKINVMPNPWGSTPANGAAPRGAGVAVSSTTTYPAVPTAPPPVSPPLGKGLDIPFQRYIVVDQFGYQPKMTKVAVLVDPVKGWNSDDSYQPSKTLEVRNWQDASVVFSGAPKPWKGGILDEMSGDRGSWFDFSSVTDSGLYYVYDPKQNMRSHPFEIGTTVYKNVLVAATKMLYFNRANVAKEPPYSCYEERCWSVRADHVGPQQDTEARSVKARSDPSTNRDLSGGWWDAGDTNKYVTFSNEAVHILLSAYEEQPSAFTDDFNIPESGNGVPDLLDELKVEIDWLKRMQAGDLNGGVLPKVGEVDFDAAIPESSTAARYYYPAACSSATIALAGEFAHAALVFKKVAGHASYARDLQERAIRAYNHFESHPTSDACDDGTIKAGDSDVSLEVQRQQAVVAAIYLFALTGDAKYSAKIKAGFGQTRPFQDDRWSVYEASQGDALLFYTTLSNADLAVSRAILERKKAGLASADYYGFHGDRDLYRAYMRPDSYHWGSNRERANYAAVNYDVLRYQLVPVLRRAAYVERVAGLLHHFHGVNPMQLVYLTNMYGVGGDECADEVFHTWFQDKHPRWDNARTSELGPAPGYLTGGPNAQYCQSYDGQHACTGSPVRSQPPGKAYVDTNKGWEPTDRFDKSWELTEPGIYYQASYIRLVSKFVN